MGRCDISGEPAPPEAEPGILVRSSFYSTHRARSVGYMIAYPPGIKAGASLPVCLLLHGYGADYRDPFDGLGFHRLLAGAVTGAGSTPTAAPGPTRTPAAAPTATKASAAPAAKVPPFVLVSVDGGSTYWHPRAGDDPLGMLMSDLPVVLGQHGLPSETFGVIGYSMGGFGALLAASVAPKRFAAVAASSPAIWRNYDDSHAANPTAFDSAADWRQWGDLRGRTASWKGIALRIDCGASDSFTSAVQSLREQLPDPSVVHIAKGCHDDAYWRSVAPAQLRLIGEALTPPKRS
jgi:pimeloyl-ACP methyl ester carboxylesterase